MIPLLSFCRLSLWDREASCKERIEVREHCISLDSFWQGDFEAAGIPAG